MNCCSNDSLTYFNLPDGKAFATIGSGSTPTTAPVVNTFDSNPSSSAAKSSAAKSSAAHSSAAPSSVTAAASSAAQSTSAAQDSTSPPTSSATAYTTIRTFLTTGSSGAVATVYITSTTAPTASPTPTSPPHPSHTGLIVGCAVGIPLGLALLGLLAFLLYRRRRNSPSSDPGGPNDAIYAGTYKAPHQAQAQLPPELGGEPIGAGRPISVLKGRAELEGTPRSVAESSSSPPPPGYSPGMMGAGGWGAERYSGGAAAAAAGQESTPGGRYISPMEDVQEMAELAGG